MSHDWIIELDHIEKTYGTGNNRVPVLHDVNMQVRPGEYIAIMGPSGSGKSTLMNILGYLDVPTSGVYRFDGEDNRNASDARMAMIRNEKIGFVFQSFHLMQRRRAWENVALPLMYRNIRRSERRLQAEKALDAVGLSDRTSFYPNQLSGGQCQRVAIARALANDPPVILADEPTGNLDTPTSRQIMELFGELNASGRTILMVTHEEDIAACASSRIVLRDGRIIIRQGVD
jgi:putative ABC transport system ATP-binding protein